MIKLLKTIFKRLWANKATILKVFNWLWNNFKNSWFQFAKKYPKTSISILFVGGLIIALAVGFGVYLELIPEAEAQVIWASILKFLTGPADSNN